MSLDLKDAIEAAEARQEQEELDKVGLTKISKKNLAMMESELEFLHKMKNRLRIENEFLHKRLAEMEAGKLEEENKLLRKTVGQLTEHLAAITSKTRDWKPDWHSNNFHSLGSGPWSVSCSRYGNKASLYFGKLCIQQAELDFEEMTDECQIKELTAWADDMISFMNESYLDP